MLVLQQYDGTTKKIKLIEGSSDEDGFKAETQVNVPKRKRKTPQPTVKRAKNEKVF